MSPQDQVKDPNMLHGKLVPTRWSLLGACALSLLGGTAVIWLFAPSLFAGLGVVDLLVVAALLLLPGPTLWVLWHDARLRRQRHVDAVHAVEAPHAAAPTPVDPLSEPGRTPPMHRPAPRRVIHEPAYSNEAREHV